MTSTRSSRYDCWRIRSTQKMRSSFVGHHIRAAFELRAGVVKAEARRVERSESLYDVEHSSTLVM